MISRRPHHQPVRIRLLIERRNLEFLVRVVRPPMHPADRAPGTATPTTAALPAFGFLLLGYHRNLNPVCPHIRAGGTAGPNPSGLHRDIAGDLSGGLQRLNLTAFDLRETPHPLRADPQLRQGLQMLCRFDKPLLVNSHPTAHLSHPDTDGRMDNPQHLVDSAVGAPRGRPPPRPADLNRTIDGVMADDLPAFVSQTVAFGTRRG